MQKGPEYRSVSSLSSILSKLFITCGCPLIQKVPIKKVTPKIGVASNGVPSKIIKVAVLTEFQNMEYHDVAQEFVHLIL